MSYVGLGTIDPTPAPSSETVKLAEGVALRADPKKGRPYQVMRAAAIWGATNLDSAVARFSQSQAGKIAVASGNALDVAYEIGKNVADGKYRADAGGVVDIARDSFKMVESVVSVLRAANVSDETLNEIMDWTGVGVSCSAGIAAAGPWGIAACGLGALAKLFSYLGQRETLASWDQPRTTFQPNQASMPLIAMDALRLAQVLRHHYGVASFRGMLVRLETLDEFRWLIRNYPVSPTILGNAVVAQDQKAVPGHNLRSALQLFSFGQGSNAVAARNNVRDGLAFIAGWRHAAFNEPSGRGLYRRYEWDQDVNQRAIGTGAWVGRSAVVTDSTLRARVTVPMIGDTAGWIGTGSLSEMAQNTRVVDFRPFVVVDELINFFAAVTDRELAIPAARDAFINQYRIGQINPTRHLYVRDHDRTGEPPGDGTSSSTLYETHCWTNLTRASTCTGLASGLSLQKAPYTEYLRDAGAARLMAALSFLHQQWAWSDIVPERRKDPVGEIEPISLIDPTAEMRLPVDPRQVVPQNGQWTLHPRAAEKVVVGAPAIFRFVDGPKYASATSATGAALRVCGTLDAALGYGPAKTSSLYLVMQIDGHERLVQQALAAVASTQRAKLERVWGAIAQREKELGRMLTLYERRQIILLNMGQAPGTGTIPITFEQFKTLQTGYQEAVAQRGSALVLKDPMQKLQLKLEKPGLGAGGVVLLGAAALIALKFLK